MRSAAHRVLPIVALSLLAGCSMGNSLTTGSIFGGEKKVADAAPVAPAAPAAPVSDPTGRALHVGAVSARATKCGYNFDPVKLKANYLASETALGATPADIEKLTKIYEVSHNGVAKAVAGKSDYCTEKKTGHIKEDLTRNLAGDYNPVRRQAEVVPEDGGLLGDMFGDAGSSSDAQGHRQIDALSN